MAETQTVTQIHQTAAVSAKSATLELGTLAQIERNAILQAIAVCGSQKDAAVLLGISPRVLNYKMRAHGIPRPMDQR